MGKIRVQNVSKKFEEVLAVNDFNIEIDDGEFVALVGPSGCGKTTTLRMLAGLEKTSGGRIFIDDKDVTHELAKDRNIAMVFQNYALYPHMTVRQNVGFSLKMQKLQKTEMNRRIDRAADLMGLKEYLDRLPKQLSGGQRQRVAVCRAIVREPAAFLFDEPLSNLDAKLRVSARSEIRALQQELNTTSVYVTHDQVEAMSMSDRIVVMDQGKIQQIADPISLYEKPQNTFVASFIGSPSMNLHKIDLSNDYDDSNSREGALSLTKKLHQYGKKNIVVGVRPEHFELGKSSHKGLGLTGKISQLEILGGETLVHLKTGNGQVWQIKSPGHPNLLVGQTLEVHALSEYIHFFDPETNLRLKKILER